MATTFMRDAIGKIENRMYYDAYLLLQKTEHNAMEAIHLADNLTNHMKSVQLQLLSSALIESAIEIDGIKNMALLCM